MRSDVNDRPIPIHMYSDETSMTKLQESQVTMIQQKELHYTLLHKPNYD